MAEVARPRAARGGQVGPLLRRTGKSCCRDQLPGSRTRKCHVESWCTPRDYSMGQRRLAPRKGPETNLCMDRRQSEARICSARGMRLLTAANSEARLRKREASPETAARESPVVRRQEGSGLAGGGLRRCFPLPQSRLAVGCREKSHASHGADPTLTLTPIPP